MKQSQSRNNARNRLPSLADIVYLGILFFLTLSGDERLLGDADTGYHVRVGEFILKNFGIPRTDIFSHLTPPLPWTVHEWLAEVVMAVVHGVAGMTGVVIFFSILIALYIYLVSNWLLNERSNALFVTAVTLFVALSSASNWLARPHIFTFVLFVIWYHLLNGYQYHKRNRLYLMPLIMLFWVNLHGGFILGLILVGIYSGGNFAKAIFAPANERAHWFEKARLLAFIFALCAAAALLNPHGYESLLFPFKVVQDKYLMDHISEYLSPNFHFSTIVPFEMLLLTTIAVFAVSGGKLDVIELTLTVLFGHLALYSSRHIPLFAIVIGPIVLKQTDIAFQRWTGQISVTVKQRLDNITHINRSTTPYLWVVIGTLALCSLAMAGIVSHDFNSKRVPIQAVKFLLKEPIQGNMFNNDEFGDYIIYAAWPKYRVFIDGRTDMYGASGVRQYINITQAQEGWEALLDKYGISWVIHEPKAPLSERLLERKDWQLIYADDVANIFVRVLPKYESLIAKYRGTKPARRPAKESN